MELDPQHFTDLGEMYRFARMVAQLLPFCVSSNNFMLMHIDPSQGEKKWFIPPIMGSRSPF